MSTLELIALIVGLIASVIGIGDFFEACQIHCEKKIGNGGQPNHLFGWFCCPPLEPLIS